jgi:uncharacterized protein (TIRG00374 family)
MIYAIIWYFGGFANLGRVLEGVDPALALAVVGVATADRFLMSSKWAFLLISKGHEIGLGLAMRIYCASMVWGIFLPTGIGADAIRAVFTCRRVGLKTEPVVASIILERAVGFLASIVLGLIGVAILTTVVEVPSALKHAFWFGSLAFIFTLTILIGSFSESIYHLIHGRLLETYKQSKFVRALKRFHRSYLDFSVGTGRLAIFFALTLIEQSISFLIAWLVARSLSIEVDFLVIVGAIPLSLLVARLPISLEGIGVFEAAFVSIMVLAGVSASEAVAIALVARVLQLLAWLTWWRAFTMESKRRGESIIPKGDVNLAP